MIPDQLSSGHTRRKGESDARKLDAVFQERVMLLELATDLQNWPARNQVFKKALDRAAQDLVRLASHADRQSNGPDAI